MQKKTISEVTIVLTEKEAQILENCLDFLFEGGYNTNEIEQEEPETHKVLYELYRIL